MSTSLVKDIQKDAIKADSDLVALLRKCKVVAANLGSNEALKWINNELNGYTSVPEEEIPEYRETQGKWQFWNPYNGWCPIIFPEELAKVACEARLPESISTIWALSKKDLTSALTLSCGPSKEEAIRRLLRASGDFFETELRFVIPTNLPTKIVEAVKNLVLDWSLELSTEGVIDEDSDFTEDKVEKGTSISNQYFIQNVGMLGNVDGSSNVANTVTVTQKINLKNVSNTLDQIESAKASLPPELIASTEKLSEQIRAEIKKTEPDQSFIFGALQSLKNILEGATGNLAAQGASALIASLLQAI
ncbi:AbiTii domain-containing protein [Henriciella algicola]|uniref:AbiTii domain-containing protein n=1 Tax=Henriciella algicola TaxID=1608422 RepID=A0A399RNR1_9PROT|nr:hypothetical protein [Henriciella algicola]RIJ31452.1 hypothetical protein D1222_04155 [Henriciella algicola]